MTDLVFSQAEQKLLIAMLVHVKGSIDTDWDKVAEDCGHKSSKVTQSNWRRLKNKKIKPQQEDGEHVSPGKRRASEEVQEDDEEEEAVAGGEEKAKGKGKRGRPAKKVLKTEVEVKQEDEIEDDAAESV